MAACVVAVVQQSTGVQMLALDLERADISTCAYVIQDGSTNAWQELGNMSIENSLQIGTAVGVVWAVAYGIKLIKNSIGFGPVASE